MILIDKTKLVLFLKYSFADFHTDWKNCKTVTFQWL